MFHVLVNPEQSVMRNFIGALLLKIIVLYEFDNECYIIICFMYIFSIFIVVFSLKKFIIVYTRDSYGRKKAD